MDKKKREELSTTKHAKLRENTKPLIYKDECYNILGACFEVYKDKGNGFLEAVYQECLGLQFDEDDIPYEEKKKIKLWFKGKELKQTYEPDFFCYEKIILEIKAVKTLADEHSAQVINYLKSTGIKLGLLVNFGHYPKVEYKRFVNDR